MFNLVIVGISILGAAFFIFRSTIKRLTALAGKAIFAYFNNKALRVDNIVFRPRKEELFSTLHEMASQLDRPLKLVEVGAGTGANFTFYPKNLEYSCVEPNEYSKKYLLANVAKVEGIEMKQFHLGFGEDMSFIETESVDVVVSTHVLCSVRDVDQCLREILRILKKGGKFLFLQHVEPPSGSRTHFWQKFFRRPWLIVAAVLHHHHRHHHHHHHHEEHSVNIKIEKAGFSKVALDLFDIDNLEALSAPLRLLFPPVIPHCKGVATK